MATATPTSTHPELKAYEDKINAQLQEVKVKLEQFEAKAKERRAQAEFAAIDQLRTTRQNIERRVRALKTTQDANLAQAKTEITAEVAKLEASIDEFAAKVKSQPAMK